MTICLSMIVKNEAHCIETCLNSVKPFIDYWIICDTGSSDNTEEVVHNCMKDIPGEFHHHQWEDFSTNRNKALQLSKSKADYIFVLDADDYLTVNNIDVFKNLDKPAYSIEFNHGPISYSRTQLFRSKLSSKYVGVLHEYLELPFNIASVPLHGCKIIFGAKGSRSQDPNKYIRDAEVFEKALLTEPNNSRYVFYAAQSYRDAGKKEESLKLYLQRSKMGGWIEERYVSLLEAAKLCESLYPDDFLKIESSYLEAFNCQPKRVEALSYLCAFCRKFDRFHKSYFYAKVGCGIAKPNDALFLETACYDWKIIDELAIAAYWIGKKQEAASLNHALLKSGMLPETQLERILKNLEFSER